MGNDASGGSGVGQGASLLHQVRSDTLGDRKEQLRDDAKRDVKADEHREAAHEDVEALRAGDRAAEKGRAATKKADAGRKESASHQDKFVKVSKQLPPSKELKAPPKDSQPPTDKPPVDQPPPSESAKAVDQPVEPASAEGADQHPDQQRDQSQSSDTQKTAFVRRQAEAPKESTPSKLFSPSTPPKAPPQPTGLKTASVPPKGDASQEPPLPGDGAVARQPGTPTPKSPAPASAKGATSAGEASAGEVVVAEAPIEPQPEAPKPVRIFAMAKPKAGEASQETQEDSLAKAAMARMILTPPSEARVPVRGELAKMDPPGKKAEEPGKDESGEKPDHGNSGKTYRVGQLTGSYRGTSFA